MEFEILRKSLKEIYYSSKDGRNFKSLKKTILREDNFYKVIEEHSKEFSKVTYEEMIDFANNFVINEEVRPRYHKDRYLRLHVDHFYKDIRIKILFNMILNVIEPICEGKFLNSSFGSRREVHPKDALHNVIRYSMTNPYFVKINTFSIFTEIPKWKVLQSMYDIGIRDKWILKIIGITLSGENKGIYQLGSLKDIVLNIILHELDTWFRDQWLEFKPRKEKTGENFTSKVNSFKLKVDTGKPYIKKYTYIWRGKKVYRQQKNTHKRKIRLKQGYMTRYSEDIIVSSRNFKTNEKWKHVFVEKLKRMGINLKDESVVSEDCRRKHINFLGYKLKVTDGTQRWKFIKIYHPILTMNEEIYERLKNDSRRMLRNIEDNKLHYFIYNKYLVSTVNMFDELTFFWDTTKSLQNDIEKKYRRLNKRNNWTYDYIPKSLSHFSVNGISLERYLKRKVVWRVKDGNVEVVHIWEHRSKNVHKYDRPSFPTKRRLWDDLEIND